METTKNNESVSTPSTLYFQGIVTAISGKTSVERKNLDPKLMSPSDLVRDKIIEGTTESHLYVYYQREYNNATLMISKQQRGKIARLTQ